MELKSTIKQNILPQQPNCSHFLTWKFEKQNGIAVAINNTVIPKSNWNFIPYKKPTPFLSSPQLKEDELLEHN
jgi:sulfur carrier protein ThiS